MGKNNRENGVLAHVAELFDLPADAIAGLPHLELIGGRQLYLENHRGILSYSDAVIDINTGTLAVRVRGEGLELLAMTTEELRIGGRIDGVDFLR